MKLQKAQKNQRLDSLWIKVFKYQIQSKTIWNSLTSSRLLRMVFSPSDSFEHQCQQSVLFVSYHNESERGTTLSEYESRLTSQQLQLQCGLLKERWRRGGWVCCNCLIWDKALIKHDPQSLIIQTASAAGLINGMDLDDTTLLCALINNSHAAWFANSFFYMKCCEMHPKFFNSASSLCFFLFFKTQAC